MSGADYPGAVWTPGPNFDSGRGGLQPRYIVLHGTASPQQDIDWWAAQASRRGGVHYMIGKQPFVIAGYRTQVIQFVRETDTAWGNGITDPGHVPWVGSVDPNQITISVELVKFSAINLDILTALQALASYQLIAYLCAKWSIPARLADESGGIMTHYQISPIRRWFCPGPYPWDGLFTYLQTGA